MVGRISLLATLVFAAIVLLTVTAAAEFKTERQLALEPGGSFTLKTDVGGVVVTGDSASGARVAVTSSISDFDSHFDLTFESRPGAATVTVKRKGGGSLWSSLFGRGGRVDFTIHVPRATTVSVDTAGGSIQASTLTGPLRINTSGGGITVNDIDGPVTGDTSGGGVQVQRVKGNVKVHTSGGGVKVSDVQGALSADTSGGGIEIDSVVGDIDASTSGGGVRIRGAGGRVSASSSGGPVTAAFAAGNAKGGTLSSSGGGVRAEVDPSVSLTIDASSSGGGVISDIPIAVQGRTSNDSLKGNLNGGGAVLKMQSSGGGVRISGPSKSSGTR